MWQLLRLVVWVSSMSCRFVSKGLLVLLDCFLHYDCYASSSRFFRMCYYCNVQLWIILRVGFTVSLRLLVVTTVTSGCGSSSVLLLLKVRFSNILWTVRTWCWNVMESEKKNFVMMYVDCRNSGVGVLWHLQVKVCCGIYGLQKPGGPVHQGNLSVYCYLYAALYWEWVWHHMGTR